MESGDQGSGLGNGTSNLNFAFIENGQQDDVHVPLITVDRIMRKVLPPNARISHDAKVAVQACVTEFIHMATSHASLHRYDEGRYKSIQSEHFISALDYLGFEQSADILNLFLARYREAQSNPNGTTLVMMPPNNPDPLPVPFPHNGPPPHPAVDIPMPLAEGESRNGPTCSSSSNGSCETPGTGPNGPN